MTSISQACISDSEIYRKKYLPMSLCYKIFNNLVLNRVITPKFIDLNHQNDFEELVFVLLNGFLSLPAEHLFSYAKRLKVSFEFIYILLSQFQKVAYKFLGYSHIYQLLNLLKEGYLSIHQYICISCYESINAILEHFREITWPPDLLQQCNSVFECILRRTLDSMLRGEVSNMESMAASLSGMCLCLKEKAGKIISEILAYYSGNIKENVKTLTQKLVELCCSPGTNFGDIKRAFISILKEIVEAMRFTEEMVMT